MRIQNTILLILSSLLLSGCLSDKAMEKRSAELITYQEQHHFQLSPHSKDELFDTKRLASLLDQFDLHTTRFEFYFDASLNKHADQVVSYLLSQGVAPQQIGLSESNSKTALELTLTTWSRIVENCNSHRHGQAVLVKGCSAESNRISQTMFIENYVSEE